ncbi:hypothetical protein CRUP_005361, partial [Coryphaenoides rupestris]
RKEWLSSALAEVSKGQLNEVEQMKRCLAVLHEDGTSAAEREGEEEQDQDQGKRESALELCVSQCLAHAQSGVRWRAAQLLAACAQNMPEVQLYLLAIGALPKLLRLADGDPGPPVVRVKALYAVSCLVREQEAGLQAFASQDGFSVLMRGMQSEDERLRTKAAFLLLNLLSAHPKHKATVLSMGMAEQLVAVLRSPHSSFHEHVLGALCCLVEDCPQGLKDCRCSSLGLEELLKHRARDLQGREECRVRVPSAWQPRGASGPH